ncbi:MAG: hypothetical protein K2Q01_01215, partial [Rickettsiales bacterium]|nr:hypothetical protein [Rickettsiales bacterium]
HPLLPIDTVQVKDLIALHNDLFDLSGERSTQPIIGVPGAKSAVSELITHEFPKPDAQHDPLSSPASWAPSYVSAKVKKEREAKGWKPTLAEGLAISLDGIHQQFVNMGRTAKLLIDIKELEPETQRLIARIFMPGTTKTSGLSPEEVVKLQTSLAREQPVPIRLALGEGEAKTTLYFKNNPVGNEGESILNTLMSLNTLANGNVSRQYRGPDNKIVKMPEFALLSAAGAADAAVRTMDRVREELERQLTEMKKTDPRLRDIDPSTVIARQFDINRDALKAIIEKQAGFLQVAGVIAPITMNNLHPRKTLKQLLSLIGKKLEATPHFRKRRPGPPRHRRHRIRHPHPPCTNQ